MKLPSGFTAAGIASGIKPAGLDLALVAADEVATAAGVFTTSAAPAAPVQVSRRHVADGHARAVVLNSGCANAATGADGLAAANRMATAVAHELDADPGEILVCSTGVIGTSLPIDRVEAAVPDLAQKLSDQGAMSAAEAIMTTDTVAKAARSSNGADVVGIAKGAGMIRPDMATMLAVVVTDAAATPDVLARTLRSAVDGSFNALSVDGCMSTNDTVVALASGKRSVPPDELEKAFIEVCRDLARQIAADGEGATKQVSVSVTGAADGAEARRLGLAVADSTLVRSSFAAADPNWGRVIAALGAAGVGPDHVSIAYDRTLVARAGESTGVAASDLRPRLAGDFSVAITVGDGPGSATIFTCDLTPDYVIENMETS